MFSMLHWYNDQMCVIDTETTGLDAHWHEIIQICILPLTSNITIRKDILPFSINMKIEFPERIDQEAIKVNKIDLINVQLAGFDKEKAKDLLREWINKLGLPISKHGKMCRIIPLGHNYAFDRDFIIRWLGIEMYNEFFSYHYADTMNVAHYLNDRAAMHGDKVPYNKLNLTSLAKVHSVDYETKHNALTDCMTTAAIYQKMLQQGLLG